ncbi:MAG: hypothetical protein K940chlam1_01367 [Candidatus Anoxychlamydiales bacterium]|nr:hypothetical protein [Candidatus Anoxychlamydiales bacterium]NGX35873.1 hypothetical protein [Candidatus Anoxychlamydiales bacterium]
MSAFQISVIASNDPIRLSKISYDQKTPSNLAYIINSYLHGSNNTYTKIEGNILLRPGSNCDIAIVGSLPESTGSETIFSLIDELGEVSTFHILKGSSEINILDFYIPSYAKKVQILAASKFKNGKISNISCYEFLVEKVESLSRHPAQA